ncbi:DDE Tnp4 domain-containing protein [Citrus sinensis]|nr:DDE Tnp4 domain-containing protein [Citrus sinensis]
MFLHTIGHGVSNRLAQERSQHFGETASKYFGEALDAICRLSVDLIKSFDPEFKDIPEEILRDFRHMPHFKDCIGTIDGTYVHVSIPPEDQIPYIGRKGIPTQNIMAACNFDMQFIFAIAGWEGSAHDTRIFLSTQRNPTLNFPKLPRETGREVNDGQEGQEEDYINNGPEAREMEVLRNNIAASLMRI